VREKVLRKERRRGKEVITCPYYGEVERKKKERGKGKRKKGKKKNKKNRKKR